MLEYTLKVFVSLLQVVLQKVVVSVGPPQNLQVRLAYRLFRSFSYLDQYFPRNSSILSTDREGTDLTDLESISDVAQNITASRRMSQKD
jgi:hypothetical protein